MALNLNIRMKKLLPLTLILIMGFFSVLAMNIAFKLAFEDKNKSVAAYEKLNKIAEEDKEIENIEEKNDIPSNWLFNIFHKLSDSSKYTYGKESYLEAYKAHTQRKG